MSTPRLNLYHNSNYLVIFASFTLNLAKRKDTRRNKSVHDDSCFNFVEGEGLFKFETKDDTHQLKVNPQQSSEFIPQSKLEAIFGQNLDKDNLGYLNSLIKTRELMDEMNLNKKKKQLRQRPVEVTQQESQERINSPVDEPISAHFSQQVRSPTLASDDIPSIDKEPTTLRNEDENILLYNRESIQEIKKDDAFKSTDERIFSELSRHSSKEALRERARVNVHAFKKNAAQLPQVKDSYAGIFEE